MKTSDRDHLARPYDDDATAPPPGPAARLGVAIPKWQQLRETILRDMSTRPPYGVAWWAPHPGTRRRILISDQLFACAQSVSDNMIESAIHWLEFCDASERLSDRFANAVVLENGKPVVRMPRPESPLEELSLYTMRMHYVGCVRALAGALDCMAGTIIGVSALPTFILRADFGKVRGLLLKKTVATAATEGERVQATLATELENLIGSVGPKGWLEWVLAFRNMLVHRGRRIEIGQYIPRTPVLYAPGGQPVPRVRVVTHLPCDPGSSDIEVFLQASRSPVLTEDVEQTLDGLLKSAKALIDGVAQSLLELWEWRGANPDALHQPKEQWPSGASRDATGFSGYAPGSFKYSPDMMISHPVILQRIRAAALDDQSRRQWATFD